MQYTLYKFFGLQRSGNHAILNWLIGLDQDNTLFFNMVQPGEDLLSRPSGVSLPEGTKAYAVRVNGEVSIQKEFLEWFQDNGGYLLLSYENYPMEKFSQAFLDKPVISRFGEPENRLNFLVLRNPFNLMPSAERWYRYLKQVKGKDENWVARVLDQKLTLWKNYAFLYLNSESMTRGSFTPLLFDKWVEDRSYRDKMASYLGYENKDRFMDFVSDAGKGSSFTQQNPSNAKDLLSRWEHGGSDLSRSILAKHPEAIDYTAIIFGEKAIPDYFKGYLA